MNAALIEQAARDAAQLDALRAREAELEAEVAELRAANERLIKAAASAPGRRRPAITGNVT